MSGEVVKLDADYIVDAKGNTLPITSWFNCDGDDCDKADAVVIVAGNDAHGFVVVDLRELEPITVN